MKDFYMWLGGQGSGKGTMTQQFLNEHPNFKYIETGAILRALPDNHRLKAIMKRGEFVPDEDLQQMITEKIVITDNIVLDGFPRQLSQAKWLVDTFSNKFNLIAVYLNISRDLMEKRIKQRVAEGGGRADDADNTVVKRRLDSFFIKTVPAIEFLEKNPNVKFADIKLQDDPIDVNYRKVKDAIVSLRTIKR